MHLTLLTLFPEMFPGPLGHSLAGKALEKGIWQLNVVNIRDFALDKHGTVDDKPFGGGTGMVMRPDVLGRALDQVMLAEKPPSRLVYMSPRGKHFNQSLAFDLINEPHVAILCGRFEGIDERIIEEFDIEEVSVGDFILSGGEIAALTVMDACIRLLPGVITSQDAIAEESFGSDNRYCGLLEYPHYTRPAEWRGRQVPEVLLSGHHQMVGAWRLEQAEKLTRERRRDLWERYKSAEFRVRSSVKKDN